MGDPRVPGCVLSPRRVFPRQNRDPPQRLAPRALLPPVVWPGAPCRRDMGTLLPPPLVVRRGRVLRCCCHGRGHPPPPAHCQPLPQRLGPRRKHCRRLYPLDLPGHTQRRRPAVARLVPRRPPPPHRTPPLPKG